MVGRIVTVLWLGMWAAACAAACSRPADPAPKPPIEHTFASADALAQAVLDGVAANDRASLQALALTEQEFRYHVWPELPTSRPERNMPMDYVWGQLHQRSEGTLAETLARYGGRRFVLKRAGFTGESTTYETFTVHRESEIVAADAEGREWVLRLYGSAMVKDGRYKLFSFVIDD